MCLSHPLSSNEAGRVGHKKHKKAQKAVPAFCDFLFRGFSCFSWPQEVSTACYWKNCHPYFCARAYNESVVPVCGLQWRHNPRFEMAHGYKRSCSDKSHNEYYMLPEHEAATTLRSTRAAIIKMISAWCFLAAAIFLQPYSSDNVSSGELYILRRSQAELIVLLAFLGTSLLFSLNAMRHSFGPTKAASLVCLIVAVDFLVDWFTLLLSWPARRWG